MKQRNKIRINGKYWIKGIATLSFLFLIHFCFSQTTNENNLNNNPKETALSAKDSNSEYQVDLLKADSEISEGAAAAAMLSGWLDNVILDTESIKSGKGYWGNFKDITINGLDFDEEDELGIWGLENLGTMSFDADFLARNLEEGPLWASKDINGKNAVAITGIRKNNANPENYLIQYNDPKSGEQKEDSYESLLKRLGTTEDKAFTLAAFSGRGKKETASKKPNATANIAPSTCPGSSDPKKRRTSKVVFQRYGAWDKDCKKVAQCIADSFDNIPRVGGPVKRCIHKGSHASKKEAYIKTKGKCNKDKVNGVGTGGKSKHAQGKAIDAYVYHPSRSKPEPTDQEELAGDEVKDWAIGNAIELKITEVIWNKQIWTAKNSWKSKEYNGSSHYNHVHLTCK